MTRGPLARRRVPRRRRRTEVGLLDRIDGEPREYTAEAATGLGHLGTVRPLDPPHTQPNFVMRENRSSFRCSES